jgi:tripartite-type tricarboxylate transporter receptor subunit TctC
MLALSLATVWPVASVAQPTDAAPYPSRPIRVVVPTVSGPPPDVVARLVAEKLATSLGRPVVVDNRPGAIGTIGLNVVAKASPDGHTLGVIAMPYVVAPSLLAKMPFDLERDLLPVTMINWSYTLFAVRAASGIDSVKDLVAAARAKPGALKFSSGGNGTPPHLAAALFAREAAIDVLHVPYKGSPAGVSALLAGEVDMAFGPIAALAPHLEAGRLKAIATAAPLRLRRYPHIPALREIGYPAVEVSDWQGIVAPAGTPAAIVARLHAELTKIVSASGMRERLDALGMEAAQLGPERFGAHLRKEAGRWNALVRATGIRAD